MGEVLAIPLFYVEFFFFVPQHILLDWVWTHAVPAKTYLASLSPPPSDPKSQYEQNKNETKLTHTHTHTHTHTQTTHGLQN